MSRSHNMAKYAERRRKYTQFDSYAQNVYNQPKPRVYGCT